MEIEIEHEDGKQIWKARKPKGRELNLVMKVIDPDSGEFDFEKLRELLGKTVLQNHNMKPGAEIDFEQVDADVLLSLFVEIAGPILKSAKKFQSL